MKKLTFEQLADIVFQRPGRVTEGVLEVRSMSARLRDRVMRFDNTGMGYDEGAPLYRLRRKLMLEFNRCAPVKEPHPRAYENAKLELKAIGFSNAQIKKIDYCLSVFRINEFEGGRRGYAAMAKTPYSGLTETDSAFIGLARIHERPVEISQIKGRARIDAEIAFSSDPLNIDNSVIENQAMEDRAHADFITALKDGQKAFGITLAPEKPNKRFALKR